MHFNAFFTVKLELIFDVFCFFSFSFDDAIHRQDRLFTFFSNGQGR